MPDYYIRRKTPLQAAIKLADDKSLRAKVNELMDGYAWKYKDMNEPSEFDWESDTPMEYDYKPGTKPPFKGVCLEQAKYIRDHIPNTSILFREQVGSGVNAVHAAPVIKHNDKLWPVYLKPRPYEEFEQNYLGKEGFDNPNDVVINQLPRREGEDVHPFDFYWLDTIPNKGDAASLSRYAKKHGVPIHVRDKKILDPNKSKYKKEFERIVKRFKKRYGIDLSHVRFDLDTVPRFNNGEFSPLLRNDEFGGSWLKNHTVVLNNDLPSVIKHWGLDLTPDQFAKGMIGHELSHDIEHNPAYKKFVKKMVEEAKQKGFETPYTKTVPAHKYNKELFCEYMSHLINQKRMANSKKAEFNRAVGRMQRLVDAAKHVKSARSLPVAKYSIHGAVLGCLGDKANNFEYQVTEDLPNDPWKAIIHTKPMSRQDVRKFHQAYNVDVDKAGVPYYFLVKNEQTGGKGVWYSDAGSPIPINTKKEKEIAKAIGLYKGLAPEQLDFKFNDNVKSGSKNPDVKRLVEEIKKIDEYKAPERTQSIRDILKSKGTNCWGISRLALNRLRKAGLDPETVFVYEDGVPMLPTHQFTTFRDGDKYRVHDYWFNDREQIGDAFDTREAAIDARVKKWRDEENHPNPVPVYVGTNLPPVGYTPEEYMGAIMLSNKLLKTYPKIEKQSALRIQRLADAAKRVKYSRALKKVSVE